MTPIFGDTSFYVALLNPRDALHAAATSLAGHLSGPMLTTEYVLIETGNWLSRTGDREVFLDLICVERTPANREATRTVRFALPA